MEQQIGKRGVYKTCAFLQNEANLRFNINKSQYAVKADVELANFDRSWISGQRGSVASKGLLEIGTGGTAGLVRWCRIVDDVGRCRTVLEDEMQMLSRRNFAAAVLLVCLPTHAVMAQNAPGAGPPVLIPAPTLPPPAAASPPPAATPAPSAIAPEPTATAPAPSASVPASTATAPPSNATAPASTAIAPALTAAPAPTAAAPAPPATAPTPTTTATAPAGKAAAPVATAPDAANTEHATKKKKQSARMTRQQEIEKSIDTGTVPARYRNSVPKEYQQYIPFAK